MKSPLRKVVLCIAFMFIEMACGYAQGSFNPIQETYSYSIKNKYYTQPAAVDGWAKKSALTTDTKDGTFFCFTENETQANDFVNTQRALLEYLRSYGIEIGTMESYGTDYSYSFSESSKNAVYIALCDVRSWQQILVTLQTVWGDYINYGYAFSLSNAIADALGWQTDSVSSFEREKADLFFSENPNVINLLFPTFTPKFASNETVNNSKALALHLFEKIDWKNALKKPIDEQLGDYYQLVSAYAQELSIPFERQICGYAYYGEGVKLRIMTTYAELIIDGNYRDTMESLYGAYWDDYSSIYQTANTINEEITAAVEYFGLEDEAGIMQIKWLDYDNSATKKFTQTTGAYHSTTQTAYITSIHPYLHEYYHHLEHLLNPNSGDNWQSQSFCELGASHSVYALMTTEHTFSKNKDGVKLFQAFTGRDYESGRDDYYEVWDIMCYYNNYYELAYKTGAQAHNSFSRYLSDLYEERTVYNLLLFPETVETVTGKTWEELQSEWEQHIRKKYINVQLSN